MDAAKYQMSRDVPKQGCDSKYSLTPSWIWITCLNWGMCLSALVNERKVFWVFVRSSPRKEVVTSSDSLFEQSVIAYRLQHHRECNDTPVTDVLFKEFCINVNTKINVNTYTVEKCTFFYVAILACCRS